MILHGTKEEEIAFLKSTSSESWYPVSEKDIFQVHENE